MILNCPAIWRHEVRQFHSVLKHIWFQFDSHHNGNVSDMFIKTSFIMENAKMIHINEKCQASYKKKKTILQLNYQLSGRLVVQSQ